MTPYTRLVTTPSKEWLLLSAIYRQTSSGKKMIYIMNRNIPMYVFTPDFGGVLTAEVEIVAHRTLSKNNCSFVTSYELNGYKGTGYVVVNPTLHDSRMQYRIQDALVAVMEDYCNKNQFAMIHEYF